ncbi:arginine--tRNA ligase [Thalassococcus sp. S3]|uniref:arginine--tRNA ligase n=1 Tax=Thalassococcus sp. S3 TaxID=2017482 RepID=UPI0010248A7A|nr:arginine--tRNA ligase [Thalassococcus sp. S3]QBF31572.1 arginine--tRNA ligase [Thalassococcus sp. S3]
MNIFADVHTKICAAIASLQRDGHLPDTLDVAAVTAEPPKDPAYGDVTTNAALVIAPQDGRRAREIAQLLVPRLTDDQGVVSVDVAGPGFINLHLDPARWAPVLAAILEEGEAFGRSALGAGKKANVEFVSAYPTSPLTAAYTRGAVYGDALANLLGFVGYDVTREYYVNDGGAQVDVLARSVYLRYLEAHGRDVAFEDGTLPGDYLVPVGAALKAKVGDIYLDQSEAVWLAPVCAFAIDAMMARIREDLDALGIRMDLYFSEKSLDDAGRIEAALADLEAKGLIYEGVLDPPQGQSAERPERREQTLFRSTAHGDEADRPIRTADGGWTYFAPDIAYHFDKIDRGYDALYDVFGSDHGAYVRRVKAVVSALSNGRVPVEIKLVQLVRLADKGIPVRRAGGFVTLRDVVDRLGPDVTRFAMLSRKNDAALDLDLDAVLDQSRDNPVFAVQYAHVRALGIVERAERIAEPRPGDVAVLRGGAEWALVQKLAGWPRLVDIAARTAEPHRMAMYLTDLADLFHKAWPSGSNVPEVWLTEGADTPETWAKIDLARAVSIVISAGLGILGVNPARQMR